MSEIYFIRHAQASFGKENYDQLSPLGIRQAEILGDYLKRLGLDFHMVYAGSMERQIGTAHLVMSRMDKDQPGLDLHIASEFDEYDSRSIIRSQVRDMSREDPSISEALPQFYSDQRAFQYIFERAVLRWVSGRYEIPSVETWQTFTHRVRKGVNSVMSDNGPRRTIAVFTSGGVISAVMQMALGLSNEDAIRLSWQILNTSVSTFKYSDKGFGLSSFNLLAHLELHNDAALLTYR